MSTASVSMSRSTRSASTRTGRGVGVGVGIGLADALGGALVPAFGVTFDGAAVEERGFEGGLGDTRSAAHPTSSTTTPAAATARRIR